MWGCIEVLILSLKNRKRSIPLLIIISGLIAVNTVVDFKSTRSVNKDIPVTPPPVRIETIETPTLTPESKTESTPVSPTAPSPTPNDTRVENVESVKNYTIFNDTLVDNLKIKGFDESLSRNLVHKIYENLSEARTSLEDLEATVALELPHATLEELESVKLSVLEAVESISIL